jgi:hypothetical protein
MVERLRPRLRLTYILVEAGKNKLSGERNVENQFGQANWRSACFRASLPNLGRFPVFLADVNAAPVWHVAAMAAVELLRNGIVTYWAATSIVLYVSHRLGLPFLNVSPLS